MNAYPTDFATWPLQKRNEFFAAEARAYRERKSAVVPLATRGSQATVDLAGADTIAPQAIEWIWPG